MKRRRATAKRQVKFPEFQSSEGMRMLTKENAFATIVLLMAIIVAASALYGLRD